MTTRNFPPVTALQVLVGSERRSVPVTDKDVRWAVGQAERWLSELQPRGNQKKLRMARVLLELHHRLEDLR